MSIGGRKNTATILTQTLLRCVVIVMSHVPRRSHPRVAAMVALRRSELGSSLCAGFASPLPCVADSLDCGRPPALVCVLLSALAANTASQGFRESARGTEQHQSYLHTYTLTYQQPSV